MRDRSDRLSRRKFLAQTTAFTLSAGVSSSANVNASDHVGAVRTRPPKLDIAGRKPIAAVATVYRPMSDAYHIAGRFIHGYSLDGQFHVPTQFVRTMFVEQTPSNDLSREVCREHSILLTTTIPDALTDARGQLAVDGVLLIGEHGNYPRNDRGQVLYPRYEMMKQVVETFRRTGRVVPVFIDRHFSHSADKAREMFEWTRQLGIPVLAGSGLPVVWRRPELELPFDAHLDEALVAAYGPVEANGFDALEALQAMVERRAGGETGVRAVTCLTGNDVWKAGDVGRWSWELLELALSRSETLNPGSVYENARLPPAAPPVAFLLDYADGLRGAVLLLNGHIQDFCFAAKMRDDPQPVSCMFVTPPAPGAKHFDCQAAHIESFIAARHTEHPARRTLLTSCVLAAAMESLYRRGARVEVVGGDIRYSAPKNSGFLRGNVAMCGVEKMLGA
jgi:hypothetical protein